MGYTMSAELASAKDPPVFRSGRYGQKIGCAGQSGPARRLTTLLRTHKNPQNMPLTELLTEELKNNQHA